MKRETPRRKPALEASALGPARLRNIIGHLITFLAVAHVRNFHSAARSLGKSQSVVTTQIRELEEMLGVSLFVRTTKVVYLTPAGNLLRERASSIVDSTRALVRDFRSQAALGSGNLRVSVSPTVAIGWMPLAIRRLSEAHPQITVSIREDLSSAAMFDAILTGDVSFGVGPFEMVPPSLTFTALSEQVFILVVPQGHPLAVPGPITMSNIPATSILCAGVGTVARTLVEAAFSRAGLELRPTHEAQHAQAVLGMVREGLGLAIIPYIGDRLVDQQGLVGRHIDDPGLRRAIGLIEVRGIQRSTAASEFVRVFPAEPD